MCCDFLLVYRFIRDVISMHRFQNQTQCRRYPTELFRRRETRTKTMDGCAPYTALLFRKKAGASFLDSPSLSTVAGLFHTLGTPVYRTTKKASAFLHQPSLASVRRHYIRGRR